MTEKNEQIHTMFKSREFEVYECMDCGVISIYRILEKPMYPNSNLPSQVKKLKRVYKFMNKEELDKNDIEET